MVPSFLSYPVLKEIYTSAYFILMGHLFCFLLLKCPNEVLRNITERSSLTYVDILQSVSSSCKSTLQLYETHISLNIHTVTLLQTTFEHKCVNYRKGTLTQRDSWMCNNESVYVSFLHNQSTCQYPTTLPPQRTFTILWKVFLNLYHQQNDHQY